MTNMVAILIFIAYVLVGVFISGAADESVEPVVIAFWPVVIAILFIFGTLSLAHEAGRAFGRNIRRGRRGRD